MLNKLIDTQIRTQKFMSKKSRLRLDCTNQKKHKYTYIHTCICVKTKIIKFNYQRQRGRRRRRRRLLLLEPVIRRRIIQLVSAGIFLKEKNYRLK